MAARKNLVIIDDDNEKQELTIYINDLNKIYLEVYTASGDPCDSQFITIDKSDAELLLSELKKLIKELD